ncbi:hypothetical protein IV203_027968 [Nitzschia inconspicua]|uniref:Uncharacterized protein n=1 Tax=Nitzschia inconspicua TaxID=303405 RepID=A0A9K3LY16_9STRA|nr:hypothetical protein IV203_027968 [Nitzschia inconspicua]
MLSTLEERIMERQPHLCTNYFNASLSLLCLFAYVTSLGDAFSPSFHPSTSETTRRSMFRVRATNQEEACHHVISTRRSWMNDITIAASGGGIIFAATTFATTTLAPLPVFAEEVTTTTTSLAPLEMKSFIDPQGLFALNVPKDFFTLRRTQKGDLPDAKTGKGRRGSSIFAAGNMAKAEVVAVERFPTKVLLEENGIVPDGDLSTFPAIGDAKAVANLIILRREREAPNVGSKVLENVQVTPDGKQLTFRLKTEIEVQKPELLLETYGVSQLFRVTVAKATLDSNDGNIMAVFASALEQDFNNGVDGPALEESVKSFQALNQQANSS